MGRVWLEAATLAHTEVRCQKVKKVVSPRKKIDLAKLASELHLRRMAPAPLLVFACVDHLGMRQLDSTCGKPHMESLMLENDRSK